ncbi:MAG: phosphomethylpyrimidine synthase ThiC, partial [bacterium]
KTGDDLNISKARRDINWENQFRYSIDPDYSRAVFKSKNNDDTAGCSMCGEFCAPLRVKKYFRHEIKQGKKA